MKQRQQQLHASHTACRKVPETNKWQKEMVHNILMDDDQELRGGLTEKKLHVERIHRRSSNCWTQARRDQDGVGIPCPPTSSKERRKLLKSD